MVHQIKYFQPHAKMNNIHANNIMFTQTNWLIVLGKNVKWIKQLILKCVKLNKLIWLYFLEFSQ